MLGQKNNKYLKNLIIIGGVIFSSVILGGSKWREYAKKEHDQVVSTFLDERVSESTELLKIYKEQKKWIEKGNFIDLIGLDIDSIRNIDIYSMRPREGYLEYTIEVTMEVPLLQGDKRCMKQKYDLLMDKKAHNLFGDNKKSVVKASPFVYHDTEQVAYTDTMSVEEEKIIKEILNVLLGKDRVFFEKYERAWLKGYDEWRNLLMQAPAFYKYLHIDEENYKDNYSLNLLPYGLEGEMMKWDTDQMNFQIGSATTKDFKYVKVNIPVEVLRDYGNKLYYNYEYLVILNKGAITSMKFIKKEPL